MENMTRATINEELKEMNAYQWELAGECFVHRRTLIEWMSAARITPRNAERIRAGLDKLKAKKTAC